MATGRKLRAIVAALVVTFTIGLGATLAADPRPTPIVIGIPPPTPRPTPIVVGITPKPTPKPTSVDLPDTSTR